MVALAGVAIATEEDVARELVRFLKGDRAALPRLAQHVGPQAAEALLPGWAQKALRAGRAAYQELGGQVPDFAAAGGTFAEDDPGEFPYATPGYQRFIGYIESKFDYGMGLLIGDTGNGKTNTLCKISDHIDRPRRFMVGYPERALTTANEIIQEQGGTPFESVAWDVRKILGLPRGSLLVAPDLGLFLDSHAWGDAPDEVFGLLLLICRHMDMPMLGDLQYTSGVGLRALMSKFLMYKTLPEAWEVLERRNLFQRALEAMLALQAVPAAERIEYGYVNCTAADFRGLCPVTLADYYTPELAKARSDFDIMSLDRIKRKMQWGFPDGEEEEDADYEELEPED